MNNVVRTELENLKVSSEALFKLSRLIDRIETGSDEVILTPLASRISPE